MEEVCNLQTMQEKKNNSKEKNSEEKNQTTYIYIYI